VQIKLLIIERAISWNLTAFENENVRVATPERSTLHINMLMGKLLALVSLLFVDLNVNFPRRFSLTLHGRDIYPIYNFVFTIANLRNF